MGWIAYDNPQEVMPIDDLKSHLVGEDCWCEPFYENDVLVHNSLDLREQYEIWRKKS